MFDKYSIMGIVIKIAQMYRTINLLYHLDEKKKLCKLFFDSDIDDMIIQLFEMNVTNNKYLTISCSNTCNYNDEQSITHYMINLKNAIDHLIDLFELGTSGNYM